MSQADRLDRAVASLHSAALDDAHWVSAAALLNRATGARGHALAIATGSSQQDAALFFLRFCWGRKRREDYEQTYLTNYWHRDERVPRLASLADAALEPTRSLYTGRERKASAVYNELLSELQAQNGLNVRLAGPAGLHVVWILADSVEAAGWGSEQIEMVKCLRPHIRQFMCVRQALADAGAIGASLSELLDNTRTCVIQLDRRGRIVEANDRARHLLLKRDGLIDEGAALTAETPEEDAELQRLLGRALPPYGVQAAGGSMRVTRPEAGAPLVLAVQPVREPGTDHLARKVGALVLVVDPLSRSRIDPALPAETFGLTPAESRVAVALAAGQSVAGIGRALGVTEGTVRVHLKRIYQKLEITGQTELVRRILSLEAVGGSPRSP